MARPPTKRRTSRPKTGAKLKMEPNERLQYLNALIFGPSGQGKTHLLGSAALDDRTAPMLIMDFEGGTDPTLTGMPGEGTDYVIVQARDWDDFSDAFERLYTNDEGFKSFGMDSLSEIHTYALLNILEQEKDRRKNPDMIEQGDYGTASVQMKRLIREWRDLPMHGFFTALSKTETDPREGLITMPAMAGKIATEAPGMMGLTGYLAWVEPPEDYKGEEESVRALLLQNWPKVRVKVRSKWGQVLPDEIYEPTVTEILDLLSY